MKTTKIDLKMLVLTALFAALCFVATHLGIKIPTPIGSTMIHFGNIFCMLSGVILGGVYGGFAAGIGSMFFDLFDPLYITSAPFTLLFKFILAFIVGIMVFKLEKKLSSSTMLTKSNKNLPFLISCIISNSCGMLVYILLFISKTYVELILLGNAQDTVILTCISKLVISLINASIAVVIATILAPIFISILRKSKISTFSR